MTRSEKRTIAEAILAAAALIGGALFYSSAHGETIGEGVKDRTATVVIPRGNDDVKVPPTYQGTAISTPAGELAGAGANRTVLRFPVSVTGRLVQTDGYGQGISHWFNDGKAKPCQCAWVHDLAIDGQAGLHNYPYNSLSKPDPHGPDFVQRADGIALNGNGSRVERVLLFQIPGTAVKILDGSGTQAGAQAMFDSVTSRVVDVFAAYCYNGVDISISDAQVCRANVCNAVKDGVVINGGGTSVSDSHTWGSDRGCVVAQTADLTGNYFEAARIGTHILPAAVNSRVTGLRIGPATCYERGVLCEANKCDLTGITGTVKANTVGVELKAIGDTLHAQLSPNPDGTCVAVQGSRHRVLLQTGWGEQNAVGVKATAAVTGSRIEITGAGAGGTVLDLSDSTLDKTRGNGNVFRITWDDWKGTTTLVKYPGGGTKYNLAPGTEVYINGSLVEK